MKRTDKLFYVNVPIKITVNFVALTPGWLDRMYTHHVLGSTGGGGGYEAVKAAPVIQLLKDDVQGKNNHIGGRRNHVNLNA